MAQPPVAVVIGAGDATRRAIAGRYALREKDGILHPAQLADHDWMLQARPRDAWTHEPDLRPWMEKF